jgi:diguanylate cyclase (GGDEF)-like protein
LSQLQAGIRIIEQQLHLKKLAMRDPLTGSLNRRIFSELQEQEWNRAQRQKSPLSCAMIDVDFFKNINDIYGHLHGDQILKRIGGLLMSTGRKSDIVCRYGGDEFCMLMPDTDLQGALVLMERIRTAIADEKRLTLEEASFPTVTIGVAAKTADMENSEAILGKADQALLWGKLNCRDVVAAYDASLSAFIAYGNNSL